MFAALIAGALLGLSAPPGPCAKELPHGPAVPSPLVLSTDCGWYRLETDGVVSRLPADWYATHKRPWSPQYGLTYQRTHAGRYLVLREGRVVWRSSGLYFNEDGSGAFGPGAFAFASWGRRGVFLTDLRGPERLVVRGKTSYPIGFTRQGELLVSGPGTITVVSQDGTVLRRVRYRRSSSFSFDEQTQTLYFVTPTGMLSAVDGSAVRRIGKIRERGWIGVLGRRLLTFTGPRHLAVLRRDDGSLVARANWHGARELDAGVAVSDDGRLFAFRVSNVQARARRARAVVYLLRAGESSVRAVDRTRIRRAGCGGGGASLSWRGSSLLYRAADNYGVVSDVAVLAPDGSATRLTPMLRALPWISSATPGNAFWASEFLE
jgi:hypothetical protein